MAAAATTLTKPKEQPGQPASQADGDKRRQILDGAREVFLASGFDGASMGEIAKAAGVSKGTLYVYFDSKDALFEALTTQEKRCLAEALFKLDSETSDVGSVLTKLGLTYLAEMSKPNHVSVIRMVIGATEKFPHLGRSFYDAGPAGGINRLTAYLDKQVAEGHLRAADTELAAKHFLNLCQAGLLTRLLFAAGEPPTEDQMRHQISEAVRVFLAGYAA